MDKVIDNRKYFLYSDLSHELKTIYYGEIYRFLNRLVFEYQGFAEWYRNLYLASGELKTNREIIICEEAFAIVGIAIIKNDVTEKKICTLRVAKSYQHKGIGHRLVELCFEQLSTEKPMITLHKNKLNQFEKLLSDYDFELKQTQKHYYSIFSTELVFNGGLPPKERIFNRIELMDVDKMYRQFVLSGQKDVEGFVESCIRCWYYREKMRHICMSVE